MLIKTILLKVILYNIYLYRNKHKKNDGIEYNSINWRWTIFLIVKDHVKKYITSIQN